MYCIKCGKALPDGTRFCNSCGTPVRSVINSTPSQKKKCGKCLNEYSNEYIFCENCGTLLKSVPMGYFNNYCILRLSAVAFFHGTSISLNPQATGLLSFFNDRIEFFPAGYQHSQQAQQPNLKNNAFGKYYYKDMSAAAAGKGIAIPYVTIYMKDGRAFSLARIASSVSTILMIINNHITEK
ncbi:MAG: zinc ribbon domain-containing protein [Ruminococcaceae bacterium]|nr:zinc ribbon domain-containing protein [Oscillospiraceae bacterium]